MHLADAEAIRSHRKDVHSAIIVFVYHAVDASETPNRLNGSARVQQNTKRSIIGDTEVHHLPVTFLKNMQRQWHSRKQHQPEGKHRDAQGIVAFHYSENTYKTP